MRDGRSPSRQRRGTRLPSVRGGPSSPLPGALRPSILEVPLSWTRPFHTLQPRRLPRIGSLEGVRQSCELVSSRGASIHRGHWVCLASEEFFSCFSNRVTDAIPPSSPAAPADARQSRSNPQRSSRRAATREPAPPLGGRACRAPRPPRSTPRTRSSDDEDVLHRATSLVRLYHRSRSTFAPAGGSSATRQARCCRPTCAPRCCTRLSRIT